MVDQKAFLLPEIEDQLSNVNIGLTLVLLLLLLLFCFATIPVKINLLKPDFSCYDNFALS